MRLFPLVMGGLTVAMEEMESVNEERVGSCGGLSAVSATSLSIDCDWSESCCAAAIWCMCV